MSAFLGPIHTWLFSKIKFQNDFTDEIIQMAKKKKLTQNLEEILNKRYGTLEEGNLESIIDETNIHGWLQERVSLVENRLAFAVTSILEEHPESLRDIKECVYEFGKSHDVGKEIDIIGAYDFLENTLLNGMPCDHVNIKVMEDNELLKWEQTNDIHKQYWDMVHGDETYYYDIRNSLIEGLFSKSSITYSQIAPEKFEIKITK